MVFSKIFFLLALSLSAVAAPPSTLVAGPSSGCSAIHIITARASTEAPGEGIIGSVVSAVVQGSSQTVSRESVNYPATLTNYDSSESLRVTDMRNKLVAQARSCPNTKIVLMGTLKEHRWRGTPWLRWCWCQPRHRKQQERHLPSLDHGLEQFSAKIASFCDTGDEFVQWISLPVHLGYVQEYGSQATAFVLGRIGARCIHTKNSHSGIALDHHLLGKASISKFLQTTYVNPRIHRKQTTGESEPLSNTTSRSIETTPQKEPAHLFIRNTHCGSTSSDQNQSAPIGPQRTIHAKIKCGIVLGRLGGGAMPAPHGLTSLEA
ncbi:hypothetical protein B0H13DRAFT_1916518 [Mycena leptocephala]|nr:hypothetical protein B0H13DRAFT_1916518 [Mycena leptocephala]